MLSRAFGFIDNANEVIAKAFSWCMLILVVTMTYEVVARYVFSSPTIWSFDVSYFLSSLAIMMGMAYTLRIKGHVNIDIFYCRCSPRVKAILDVIFSLLLFFPLWYLMSRAMIEHVQFSWGMRERAWVGTWLPAIYPFKTWVTIGVLMLLLQGIVEFVRDLYVAITGGERP